PAEPTVTVLLDVEVYDQPGGNGKVIGELKAGAQGVSLVEPCRADHWCHVRGNFPTGKGWVWSGPGYQALKV
ncbi:MAG: SH3 domain-containing protein, partial [Methyloceanibacter sp.]